MKLRYFLALPLLLIAPTGVVPASASEVVLTTGQCLPAPQVRAALAAEKQDSIMLGNRTGYGYATSLVFTSNTDGSKGYLIRGDKPLGEQATTICIDSVYRDIRLNDITKPGVPAWAMMKNNPQTALTTCTRENLGYQGLCRSNDQALLNFESSGQRLLFLAKGTVINPADKSVRNDQIISVTFRASASEGAVSAATADGANYALSAYTKVTTTQFTDPLAVRLRAKYPAQ